ncbi:hypothetical protein AAHB33_09680 [Paenarthrobacter sp. S56]|uniref:hypothetical protein n=1 Tax=Paenarthrobacter sp. S56 TaxID=3138179 RepID=UPI00321AED4A
MAVEDFPLAILVPEYRGDAERNRRHFFGAGHLGPGARLTSSLGENISFCGAASPVTKALSAL